ncbi:MAG: protein kinase domain-containing protein, partial [Pyrinomonadaceae bacterium]
GSYAEIYVAHDNAAAAGAPETIVIKALNMFLQETPDEEMERTLVANFQNEAVALDRVRHPNVINRLGHGTAIDLAGTTFHYIVLEYLPGGDMAALSRSRPQSIEKALFYLEQVCSGLAHAHKCGVIHRDIKPQNLLLTADRKIVKIADFGVARLEATEGAITRVGTNIYAAPEHNPLVHTAQLDSGTLVSSKEPLTPAADVYSLAKTTYSLLAGEAPRRFAQHSIKELPASLGGEYWAGPVLRVLEKATQTRPENRYQSVEEFWDELAEAALRPTEPLRMENLQSRRKPSEELEIEPEEFTQAPPQARFSPVPDSLPVYTDSGSVKRPRIVVPVNMLPESGGRQAIQARRTAKEIVAAFPERRPNANTSRVRESAVVPSRSKRLGVAAVLVLAFSGMLLATHRYVTSHWNPLVEIPRIGDLFVVGREGLTTTDVNLRPDASSSNTPIGLAEYGSRVKILSINSNWYEVQVMEHGRAKTDPYSADRGWVNKKFVKFD